MLPGVLAVRARNTILTLLMAVLRCFVMIMSGVFYLLTIRMRFVYALGVFAFEGGLGLRC